MLLFVVVQIAAGIWLVSMELESRRTDIVWPGVLFRYTLAVTSSLLMPLMVVGISHCGEAISSVVDRGR